jgi:hypothetical protein
VIGGGGPPHFLNKEGDIFTVQISILGGDKITVR